MTPLKKLRIGGFNRDNAPLLLRKRLNLGVVSPKMAFFRLFSPTSEGRITFFQ